MTKFERRSIILNMRERVYKFHSELAVITCYYNPALYQTRYKNYLAYVKPIEDSGIYNLTVECAFGNQDFTLPYSDNILRVNAESLLWQKERLLNMAIAQLPKRFKYVVWADADVMFDNPYWTEEVVNKLQTFPVVQPFKECVRLDAGNTEDCGEEERYLSFGYVTETDDSALAKGKYNEHGHTGFAWAARRELLDQLGLYDAAIAGAADDLMAHAAWGDWESRCTSKLTSNPSQKAHYEIWAKEFHELTGKVGYVDGKLLHLYHGSIENRNYVKRHTRVTELGFNPFTDLKTGNSGCLEWTKYANPELVTYFNEYFNTRNEDEKLLCHNI